MPTKKPTPTVKPEVEEWETCCEYTCFALLILISLFFAILFLCYVYVAIWTAAGFGPQIDHKHYTRFK